MKILAVTGATGKKTGSAFARLLVEHADSIKSMFPDGVRLLVRFPEKLNGIDQLIPSCEIWKGHLEDEKYLINALKEVDTVVHIACIQTSRQIVKAAVENHVRRLILVHSTGIYSKHKAAGEEYRTIEKHVYQTCKEHGIALSILRPTMIYGNRYDTNIAEFIKMVDKFPIMPVVNGARYKLQPVHYEDVADGCYQVLTHEGATVGKDYNLSGGEEIELRDMLTEIGKNLGKQVRFISCPFPIAYAGAWGIYLLTLKKRDYREKVQRLCEPRVYSYEDARRDFGYHPRTFRIGVVDEVKEYKRDKNAGKKWR